MRIAFVLVVVLAAAACTARQARSAHRAGEVMTAAGLIGLMGTIAVAELDVDDRSPILHAGLTFVPIAVVGALMYAATDGAVNRAEAPQVSAARGADTAMALAREAKHAARRGDCAEVLALEPRVRELDAGIYRRFRRDEVIRTCLPPVSGSEHAADALVRPRFALGPNGSSNGSNGVSNGSNGASNAVPKGQAVVDR